MALPQPTCVQVRHLSEKATEAVQRSERNRLAVSALLDYTTLPYSTFTPRPDHVYITVPTVADLHRWAHALREEGVRSHLAISEAPFHGFLMWVLETRTPPGKDDYSAPLRIAAAVPTGAPLPFELADLDWAEAAAS